MRFHLRGAIAVLLSALLLLTACSGEDPAPTSDEPPPPVGLALANPAADFGTDDLVDLFADAGVTTVADAGTSEPLVEVTDPGPVTLIEWQVETMTRQLNAGLGYRAADLDDLVRQAGAGSDVPIAVVLAAWLKAAQTPAAQSARAITGEQDWAKQALQLVYPDAVVMLFVHDLTVDPAGEPTASPASGPAAYDGASLMRVSPALAAAPPAAGICTTLTNVLTGTLDSIVDKLKINASTGVGGVLASIWNTVIEIAASAAKTALAALTAPVIKVIKTAAVVLAVLSSASSLLSPWAVETAADPDPSHFAIEPAAATAVEVTSTVTTAINFSWPPDVTDCALAAGVKLPDPGSAKDSPVSWTLNAAPQEIAQKQSQDEKVGADGTARLRFTTGSETAKDHDQGVLQVGVVNVSTDVERTQVDDLLKVVEKVVISQLPGPAGDIVASLLGPLREEARIKLEQLLQVKGKARAFVVSYHGPAVEEPPPPPGGEPPPECESTGATTIPDGVFAGPIKMRVIGSGGSLEGSAVSKGNGSMQVAVKGGKVVGGKWKVTWLTNGIVGSTGTTLRLNLLGKAGGGISGAASAPTLRGTWSINGNAFLLQPVNATLPISFDGKAYENLRIFGSECNAVSGTFVPSFNSKGGEARFDGTATWTGTRVP